MRLPTLILLCACVFIQTSDQTEEDTTDVTSFTNEMLTTITTSETVTEQTVSSSTEPVIDTTTKPLTKTATISNTPASTATQPEATSVTMATDEPVSGSTDGPASSSSTVTQPEATSFTMATDEPVSGSTDGPAASSSTVTQPEATSFTMATDEPVSGSTDGPATSSSTVTQPESVNVTILTDEPVSGPTDGPPTKSGSPEESTTQITSSDDTEEPSSPRPTTVTTRPTEPPASTRAPAYPEETYPDISGPSTVLREIQVEVAVIYDSCDPNDSSTKIECDKLKTSFVDFVSTKYETVSGFLSVTVDTDKLRTGSVIIPHTVFYNYNEMEVSDKKLSADEIYDKTLGPSVEDTETTDGFTFTECTDCTSPQDKVDLCDPNSFEVDCPDHTVAHCENYVWVCQSPCASSEDTYCDKNNGFCTQKKSEAAVCYCQQSEEGWYIGSRCQMYINRLGLIIGVSVGGGILLILIIVLIVCLCRAKKEAKESKKLPYERTTEGFLLGQNDLELDQVRTSYADGVVNEAFDHPVEAGELDDNFNPKTGRHVSNPELEQVLQERAKQNGKNANSETQYFWGNLQNEYVKGYDNKPTSQNQLNRQSNNYAERKQSKARSQYGQSASIPPTDYGPSDPFSKRYSKIIKDDYGSLSSK